MQMRHRFPGVRAVIEHQPIAALLQAELLRYLSGFEHQMAQHLMIDWERFGHTGNGLFGNQQDMSRRLRSYIVKGHNQVVLVNDFRWNLSGNDFLKKSLAHTYSAPATARGNSLHD